MYIVLFVLVYTTVVVTSQDVTLPPSGFHTCVTSIQCQMETLRYLDRLHKDVSLFHHSIYSLHISNMIEVETIQSVPFKDALRRLAIDPCDTIRKVVCGELLLFPNEYVNLYLSVFEYRLLHQYINHLSMTSRCNFATDGYGCQAIKCPMTLNDSATVLCGDEYVCQLRELPIRVRPEQEICNLYRTGNLNFEYYVKSPFGLGDTIPCDVVLSQNLSCYP
uniref:Uncharacterized protein n=1 Tax=Osugoroshi virus TaxID=2202814 RepID=A0A7R7YCF5_9VIRU|nr:hypothetical protein [Osugoroshi virus]